MPLDNKQAILYGSLYPTRKEQKKGGGGGPKKLFNVSRETPPAINTCCFPPTPGKDSTPSPSIKNPTLSKSVVTLPAESAVCVSRETVSLIPQGFSQPPDCARQFNRKQADSHFPPKVNVSRETFTFGCATMLHGIQPHPSCAGVCLSKKSYMLIACAYK